MIQSLIHSTEYGNVYLYDDMHMLSLLVHPELKKVCENSENVDPYYLKKYKYLKKYGFFDIPKSAEFGKVNERMVEEGIINVPQILFEVTDLCNLNCTYCGYGELYEVLDIRNKNNIDLNNALIFLEYILSLKLKCKKSRLAIGFYGGEALLNIEFIRQIVDKVKSLNYKNEMDIQYSMTTNATLIDRCIDFLVENKFDINISLDGNRENHSYRIFRGSNKSSFDKVIENTDMIFEKYPNFFDKHVNFISVLHNRNSIKSIYEFINNRYHKIPIIVELATKDVSPDKKNVIKEMFHNKRESENEYLKETSDIISKVYSNSSIHNELKDFVKCYSVNYYLSNLTSLLIKKDKYYPTSTCLPLARKIFLTTHNKLLPCEKVNYKYCMGSVNGKVQIDIPKITKMYAHYYEILEKVCRNCFAYKFCGLCMYHIENLDKLDTEEFICERFYDKNRFGEKLYRVFSYLEKHPKAIFQILEDTEIK